MRVAFLTNIVSPYRRPVFADLAATPGWRLRYFVNAEREFDRHWEVDFGALDVRVSRSLALRRTVRCRAPIPFEQEIALHLPWGIWGDLRRFRPDVILSHELGPRSLVAAAYARWAGVPLALWSYQSRVSGTQGARREVLRRALLAQAECAIGMGTQAREVLRGWGVPDARIVDAPNAADAAALRARIASPGQAERVARLRAEWSEGERQVALVIGRLVPLKGTVQLLELWGRLPAELRRRWRLVFVGDGPLRERVERCPDESVRYAGRAEVAALADHYQASDLHIFPTLGDVWGLVVNEATACGVANLCSVHAGCADDLIRPGETGLLYDPSRPEDALRRLEDALRREDLGELGRAGAAQVEPFTSAAMAAGLREGVRRALANHDEAALAAWGGEVA